MYKLVDGTYDYLPQNCYNLGKLENTLEWSFVSRGFRKIETPIVEKFDLFSTVMWKVDSNKLFKFTDSDGELLVLRSDMTVPISRVVNTKLTEGLNAKYCYVANSFNFKMSNNSMREFTQAGVEIFAPSTSYVDADIIALAINTLIEAGLKSFQIDIGNVEYFKGLLKELQITSNCEEELVKLVDAKDSFGIELFSKKNNLEISKFKEILNLPNMYGGVEVLELAKQNLKCVQSIEAINGLQKTYKILSELKLEQYVSFDLSLVNGVSYYSGVVFKGITKHFGAPILSGGRYDNLSHSFNNNLPATGFAIGVNNLLQALTNQNGHLDLIPQIDVLIGGNSKNIKIINSYINQKLKEGLIVENSYVEKEADFFKRFKQTDAKIGIFIKDDGNMLEVKNG